MLNFSRMTVGKPVPAPRSRPPVSPIMLARTVATKIRSKLLPSAQILRVSVGAANETLPRSRSGAVPSLRETQGWENLRQHGCQVFDHFRDADARGDRIRPHGEKPALVPKTAECAR